MQMWKSLSCSTVQVYNKVSGFCSLTPNRWISIQTWTTLLCEMLYQSTPLPPPPPCETGAAVWRVVGLSGILNWTRHSYLHLHCVSRATAFPFSTWQYPSFLFISRLSGRRKWITGLSRRGTGAITEVCEKRNFDMWGLLTLYSLWTLGVRDITALDSLAAKANRPAGVISSALFFSYSVSPASHFHSHSLYHFLPLVFLHAGRLAVGPVSLPFASQILFCWAFKNTVRQKLHQQHDFWQSRFW